ncbi:MAG: amidophosphoribosyltransferase [Buchananella hordeovulneris]|nr:amidophosphoribosyltransferase [Buchananella hordeovulneris]
MTRPDGTLTAELDPTEGGQDECGVFGVWSPGEDVAQLTYYGLFALQHRGTQSAGIATSDGSNIIVYKDMGLVSQVFDDKVLGSLRGHLSVGHVRYATQGPDRWENAQPMLGPSASGTLVLAHNGNLTNTRTLLGIIRDRFGEDLTGELGRGSSTDTAVLASLIGGVSFAQAKETQARAEGAGGGTSAKEEIEGDVITSACSTKRIAPSTGRHQLLPAVREVLPMLQGAFSLAFMDETTLYAARDRNGVRPLVLGRLERGWAVASETAALDIIGATFVREVEPGEIIAIDEDGVHSEHFADSNPKGCVFEYVYLARPDTIVAGQSIQASRVKMGELLARDYPVDADLVIPTPDSGTPAAIGYARASGIPYGMGLVKNAYVGRTFIQPTQTIRQRGIRLKLNPLRHVIEGKRLVVIDDSIVRGNTQRALVKMLREAGAKEVHVRISSPPVLWPCFYGIDFATRAELIAAGMDVQHVCDSIGADSLGYLSQDAMVEASGQNSDQLCTACFTGDYPIPVEGFTDGASPHEPVVLPRRTRMPSAYRGASK